MKAPPGTAGSNSDQMSVFATAGALVAGTVVGFGLVVNTYASWLPWQGSLLGPFGLGGKTGTWEYANLGVIAALVVAFLGWLVLGRATIRRQESAPETVAAPV